MMIDPSALSSKEVYQLVISCVVPRPIALVTSVSERGIVNAAPFSFFNAVSAEPPILMIAVDKRHGERKDTAANILRSKEFVVHIVDETIAEPMNVSSASFPPDHSEVEAAGFTLVAGEKVNVPRIVESGIQMECRCVQHLELGKHPSDIFFGEVVAFHIREDLLHEGKVDPHALRVIGRLGGNFYCRTRDLFEMVRPK
jgi:flavin reductase (DIM6/NTAB) family NADH-FMN oxidoreductase RutF